MGISWLPTSDNFTYNFSLPSDTYPNTKRLLTSEIASIFDPLGWISCVTLKCKHILQTLWKSKLDWDEEVNDIHVQAWLQIKSELIYINQLQIPRWINYVPGHIIQLHGFCDAAETGYAAAVYFKNVTENTVNLLVAKARVAPIKEESNSDNVTIPRLELCGALLLAKLMKQVVNALDLKFDGIYCWTDSKIVLGWINGNPIRYKTFVASRISKLTKINKEIEKISWHHLSSENNAADCASRGLTPLQVINHDLWWHGPQFSFHYVSNNNNG